MVILKQRLDLVNFVYVITSFMQSGESTSVCEHFLPLPDTVKNCAQYIIYNLFDTGLFFHGIPYKSILKVLSVQVGKEQKASYDCVLHKCSWRKRTVSHYQQISSSTMLWKAKSSNIRFSVVC